MQISVQNALRVTPIQLLASKVGPTDALDVSASLPLFAARAGSVDMA
jgi:hypothetical protein